MTNQPTNNEWIEKARLTYNEIPIGGKECKDEETAFKQAILYNLPKPTEVVAPVDIDLVEDIMEDVHNQSCIIKGDRAYIDLNTLKMILAENISKITTPVEPINQERTDSKVV